MAHFRGTVQGGRTEASRLGHKSSGLTTRAASWQGAVEVRLYEANGVDMCSVYLTRHNGAGVLQLLYSGPVGEYKPNPQG
jgi:hypothetical protein